MTENFTGDEEILAEAQQRRDRQTIPVGAAAEPVCAARRGGRS